MKMETVGNQRLWNGRPSWLEFGLDWLYLLVLCCFGASSFSAQTNPASPFDYIQTETHWKPAGGLRSYDSKTLPNLRPKEALIFNEYGFTRLDIQEFQQHGNTIVIEIYEMADPTAAYGIYTFLRSGAAQPLQGIGNMGEQQDFEISFAQNRYYVKMFSPSRSSLVQPVLLKMARILSRVLPKSFVVPSVVTRLPQENLMKESVVFVLGFRALNQKFPFGNTDLFGLENGAEAVLAEYRFPQDSAKLLLINYPTQQLAKKYLQSGYQAYAAQNPNQSIFFRRDGPQVVLVLGAKSAEAATALLEKMSYVSTVSWDPKAQPLSIARMMLNIFLYIGVMLVLTLMAGIAFGFIRVLSKKLFPNRLFDRRESMEIIRLNLSLPKK